MNVCDIPGYIDAVLQEQLVRDASLLRLREDVAGFECLPFTLRHYLILRLADSPFIPPFRVPMEDDLEFFLWVVSPWYSESGFGRKLFRKCCRCFTHIPPPLFKTKRGLDRWKKRNDDRIKCLVVTIRAAQEYVTEALQDRPASGQVAVPGPSYYSDIIGFAAGLMREYPLTLDQVLTMPTKISFQLAKEATQYRHAVAGQNALLGNPSDRIKAAFLKTLAANASKN